MNFATRIAFGSLVGAVGGSAQLAVPFGELYSPSDSQVVTLASLPLQPMPMRMEAIFGFAAGQLNVPLGSTPEGDTTFELIWNSVKITVTPATGTTIPSPATFEYGPISLKFDVTIPAAGGGVFSLSPDPSEVSLPTKYFTLGKPSATAPWSESVTVSLVMSSAPTLGGGKAGSASGDAYVKGTLVPEPSTYALLAGLGLVGFAAWRRCREA